MMKQKKKKKKKKSGQFSDGNEVKVIDRLTIQANTTSYGTVGEVGWMARFY